jgi:hypothetical protein
MNTKVSRKRREQRRASSTGFTVEVANPPHGDVTKEPDSLIRLQSFPDPWLFDSEKLLRELDRCREIMLNVPNNGDRHATHFALNIAINAIWSLREQLRHLLHLHREGQRQFAKKHHSGITRGKRDAVAIAPHAPTRST